MPCDSQANQLLFTQVGGDQKSSRAFQARPHLVSVLGQNFWQPCFHWPIEVLCRLHPAATLPILAVLVKMTIVILWSRPLSRSAGMRIVWCRIRRNLESENRSLKNKLAKADEARRKTADNLTSTGARITMSAHSTYGPLSSSFGSHSKHD